ncbi:MAG: hypothetical protein Q7R35_19510 [Elusimicrobiota bacterium]|nr:hypothetical protein [Elusimicrobiota bacterium]
METPKNKNSVFAGLFPASEPAPAPAPAPQAPKPEASDEKMAALNKKIEQMERAMAEQAENKDPGQAAHSGLPSPHPVDPGGTSKALPPQFAAAPEFILKMTEMESRLKEFQEKFLFGASQMKNIEESKISARREIEDLLKAVREQQKYSEMDRQLHDQLEKSWKRVEDIEKKLMDFYSILMSTEARRREETAASSVKSASALEGLAARLAGLEQNISALALRPAEAIVELSTRLAGLDQKISAIAARPAVGIEALAAGLAGLEEKIAALADRPAAAIAGLTAGLAGLEQKTTALADRPAAAIAGLAASLAGLEQKTTALADRPAAAIAGLAAGFSGLEQKITALALKPAAAIEGLSARLAVQDQKISSLVARPEIAESHLKFLRDQAALFMKKTAAYSAASQEAASRGFHALMRVSAESFKEFLGNCVRGELEHLHDKVAGEAEAIRCEAAESAAEHRRFLREQAAVFAERTAEFGKLGPENILKAEGIEAALEASAGRRAQALEELTRRLEADLQNKCTECFAGTKKENDERFEKFGAKYADALVSATFLEGFKSDLGSALERVEFAQNQMTSLLKEVPPEKLEGLMGVSGMMFRKKFEAVVLALEKLKADSETLRGIKRGVEERFRDIFGTR